MAEIQIITEVKIKHTEYKFHFSKGLSNKSNQRKLASLAFNCGIRKNICALSNQTFEAKQTPWESLNFFITNL